MNRDFLRVPTRLWRYVVFLFCGLLIADASADELRIWEHRSGSTAEAKFVSQDETFCTLRLIADDRIVRVRKSMLSTEDQDYLRALAWVAQDRAQWELVVAVLPTLIEKPGEAREDLLKFHHQFDKSPYAGLMAGIAMCLENNQHATAHAIFTNVTRRIEEQRAVRPGAHDKTLASVKNNDAVCRIKSLKGSSAANLLIDASGLVDPALKAVSLNAKNLAAVADGSEAQIVLSRPLRKQLLSVVARTPTAKMDQLRPGYYYSTIVDLPRPDATGKYPQKGTVDSLASGVIRDHWCIACDGRGFLKCANKGCGNGVITVRVRQKLGENFAGPVYGTVPVKKKCPVCSGGGGRRCVQCKGGRI